MSRVIEFWNGIRNVIASLGTTKDKAFNTEVSSHELPDDVLDTMYINDWLSAKIIDIPVEDMLREGRSISSSDLKAEDITGFEAYEKFMKVEYRLETALKWARLKGTAFIVMGLPGETEVPIDVNAIKKGDLKFLKVVDRTRVSVSYTNRNDPSITDYDDPEHYMIGGRRFHKSRVIRIDTDKKPPDARDSNPDFGIPILQRVFDAVMSAEGSAQIVNSMMYEARINVISIPGFTKLIATPDGEKLISDRFAAADKIKSINNTLILDGSETFTQHNTTFAGLADIMRQNMQTVSGAADIPATRLFGAAAQGLNATGENDTRNYYDMLSSKMNKDLRRVYEELDAVTTRSYFGVFPVGWGFEFNPLWQMSEKEIEDIAVARAGKARTYFDMGVLSPGIIGSSLLKSGEYPELTEEYVNALREDEGSM